MGCGVPIDWLPGTGVSDKRVGCLHGEVKTPGSSESTVFIHKHTRRHIS